jgi:hypothetical protein
MVKHGLGWMLAGVLAGCAVEGADEELEPRTLTATIGWGCHTCGFKNSPMLGKHPVGEFGIVEGVHDFTLSGIEEPTGLRHKARINGNRVEAHTPQGIVEGTALVGWKLIFDRKGVEHEAQVLVYEQHPDWVDGTMIDTYSLAYQEVNGDGPLLNLCPGLPLDGTNVVFTPGERYIDASKTVVPSPDSVTMGCKGHAVAKIKFMGQDPNDAYGSEVRNRQAALRMVTAAYCPSAESYTEVGQNYAMIDESGGFPFSLVPTNAVVEARWDENGAVCLSSVRNEKLKLDDVACKPPACAGAPDDLDGSLWMSYDVP